MKRDFSLGIWFIITGAITILATLIITNITFAAPDYPIIQIKKTTPDLDERPGPSKMVLLDENYKKIMQFEVEANVGYTELYSISPGKYYLSEITSPDGFAFASDMEIIVEDVTDIQVFEFQNTPSNDVKLSISMIDLAIGYYVAGSKIQILDSSNNEVGSCTTNNYGPCIFQGLDNGTYTIKEIDNPAGYIPLVSETFEVSDAYAGKTITIDKERDFTRLEICKIDSNTGTQLANAVFELYDSNGKLYDRWTTDKYVHQINRIPVGTYTLKEASPPPGYKSRNVEQTIIVGETPEIVYIKFPNNPVIDVPNTAVEGDMIFYILGGVLLALGMIIAIISYRKR